LRGKNGGKNEGVSPLPILEGKRRRKGKDGGGGLIGGCQKRQKGQIERQKFSSSSTWE
jgi:hypothetical protein